MTSKITPIELGCAGHFICAKDCHWRRHTQVGNYRVSSVGDLYYHHEPLKRQTIGSFGFFETMVFKTTPHLCKDNDGCGCFEVETWTEHEGERYETAGDAQAGHERYVAKYLKMQSTKRRKRVRKT